MIMILHYWYSGKLMRPVKTKKIALENGGKQIGSLPDRPPPYSASVLEPPPPNMTVPPPLPPRMTPVVQTIIVQQFAPRSTVTVCNSCNHQVETRVEFQPTTKTHLFALILCFIGCWPLACLPYCMDSCNTANHYCPSCNSYMGSYVS